MKPDDLKTAKDSPAWGLIAVLGWEGEIPVSHIAVVSDQTLDDLEEICTKLPPIPGREYLDTICLVCVENERKFRRGELTERAGFYHANACRCLPPEHVAPCLYSYR